MRKISLWAFCLLLPVVARANLFGADRRSRAELRRFPFDTIGLVQLTKVGGPVLESCTGTLVSPEWLLTASHCVAARQGHLREGYRTHFRLAYAHGKAAREYVVTEVRQGEWRGEDDTRRGDWALARVMPEGKLSGKPPSRFLSLFVGTPEVGTSLIAVGYSSDFQGGQAASVDSDCHVRAVLSDGVVQHDCGTYAGASGGPLLVRAHGGEWRILAVHNAHKSRGTPGLHLPRYDAAFANLGSLVSNVTLALHDWVGKGSDAVGRGVSLGLRWRHASAGIGGS